MMKYSAVVAALLASAVMGFAPVANQCPANTELNAMPNRMWDSMVDKTQRSKSLPFLPRPANLDGSMAGDVGFDPFYLSSIPKNFAGFIQPPSWEETEGIPTLYWMRESELKHSRVCMLAWFGWLATDGAFGITLRFPGAIYSVDSIPNAYSAHNILVEQGSMAFLLLAVGFVEFCSGAVLVEVSKGASDREAGDFTLDPLQFLKGKSTEEVNRMKTRELLNGRLAMLAFGGVSTQSALLDGAHQNFPYF
jgi:Chlorophyll A-B binding protein